MNTLTISYQPIRIDFFEWILTKMPRFSLTEWLLQKITIAGTKHFNSINLSIKGALQVIKEQPELIDVKSFVVINNLNKVIGNFYTKMAHLTVHSTYEKEFIQALRELYQVTKDFENYIIMQSFEDDTPMKGFGTTFNKEWNSKEDEIWETYL